MPPRRCALVAVGCTNPRAQPCRQPQRQCCLAPARRAAPPDTVHRPAPCGPQVREAARPFIEWLEQDTESESEEEDEE